MIKKLKKEAMMPWNKDDSTRAVFWKIKMGGLGGGVITHSI